MNKTTPHPCPLCTFSPCTYFHKDNFRIYLKCLECGLVFVPAEYHLSIEEEKNRYSKHTNTANDEKYVSYLSTIADEILALPVQSPRVLDFGSGPEQVLAGIINGRGVRCASHDPLYGIFADNGGERFDIIVACEVFEHLGNIPKEISLVSRLVKPGGFVYVHTQLYDEVKDFLSWWYIKDLTHINFYCTKTMETVAEMMGRKIYSSNKKDVVIFR